MKSTTFFHRIAYYLLLCIILSGCTEEQVPIEVTSVTLDSTSITLIEGENHTLTATISPSNAENLKVLWSSSNSSVASVKEGVVTAIKAGAAIITAKSDDGGKTATCEVTVNAKVYPVESVSLDKTSYEMTEGDEFTLTATITPDNATNKNVIWSSNNTSVATVSNGKVTALKAGTATITAKTEDGDKTATCEVTVNAKAYPVESVSLDKTSYEMTEGDEFTLTATITPENATNKNVIWSSNNTSVATVENGKVTALKVGSVTITVKTEDGEKIATCEIVVKQAVYYIDEYGVNHGTGVKIGINIWAPVNCGYHSTDFKYGKLYQWGRKYGQGYSDGDYFDNSTPTLRYGGVSADVGNDINNKDNFYMGQSLYYNDWISTQDDKLWNSGTEEKPIKTDNDPCPNGWRLPTHTELEALETLKRQSEENSLNQHGVLFIDNKTDSQIFFPKTGYRGTGGACLLRGVGGYYWSSSPTTTKAYHLQILGVKAEEGNRAEGQSVRCVQE